MIRLLELKVFGLFEFVACLKVTAVMALGDFNSLWDLITLVAIHRRS